MRCPLSIVAVPAAWGILLAGCASSGTRPPTATRSCAQVRLPKPPAFTPQGDPQDRLTTVQIQSNPAGAEIRVGQDGAIRGRTPMILELPTVTGEVEMRLLLAGYEEEVMRVPLEQDQDVRIGMTETEAHAAARCGR